jgi:hypothetical protein
LASNFRPEASFAAAALVALLLVAALAPDGAAARRARPPGTPAVADSTAPVYVADDSTRSAQALVSEIRSLYGGDDNYAAMEGIRYYLTYTIPGPGGAPVRTWTEAHYVWLHGAPRARIETVEDSSIVIVSGDTTRVRRDGRWIDDPPTVAAARQQALDAVWSARLPRNLLTPAIRARQLDPAKRGVPFTTRFWYEHPDLDRPQGTILDVTFAPPAFTMRRLRTFDPRSGAWTLLDLEADRSRYDWTWAERRTLRAANDAGEPGPVLWTAVVQDMQIEGRMPAILLSPPDAGVGVVTPEKGR